MDETKLLAKITNFLSSELLNKMSNIAIYLNEDGNYCFFNRYEIKETSFGCEVIVKYNSDIKKFSSLKNAVTWCFFENTHKFIKARRIEYLDQMISSLEMSVNNHRKLIKNVRDIELKLIYLAKLSEAQNKKKHMIVEMSAYIAEAKYLQTQKFAAK